MLSCVVTWCHVLSYDVLRYHMMSCAVTWCHVLSHDVMCCHMMSCAVTWCHVLSHGVMCCHMVSWSHAVMYYRISFRPLQIQFLVMLVHCTHSLLIECGYDRRPQWIYFFYLLSHIALFSNFYRNAYIKPKGTSDGGSDAALQKKAHQKKEQ